MKKGLLVTDGLFHPPFCGRMALHRVLRNVDGYRFEHTRSLEKLPAALGDFSALVVYIHHETISDEAIRTFDEYVSSGGGVLAVHSATASSKRNDAFTDILGGKFVGHGPVEPFVVTPVVPESRIFGGIGEFQVTDELYIHDLQPDIETHFTTIHEGQPVPIVWTRLHGAGRVCYTCPGHLVSAFRVPEYREILVRGLTWVAERKE